MTVKSNNKVLSQFAEFLPWVERLKVTAQDVWLKPIAVGKWSVRELLTHIMYWDKNSLDAMVPNMEEGAELSFVDIESHNQEAAVLARSYESLDVLIDDVIQTRKILLALLEQKYDDKTRFRIDNSNYSFKRFVNIFIHHDQHHQQQVEVFLERERSA
ncbi:hypothetical protein JCM10914A_29320 [Paenibacillus sp. JCM 10914]|uniref:DinB family protein n=1 Tax=Paenibacillus sp. JCM 10914 TaxID=1236974 RepID=UPI0003CC95FE|nr:DinB family protein [Paenibacillus sp. JCM 10914]GAE09429.1 hypothetical protein JCM10914_5789 [Paenibacillus sp. JCM 10914]